MPKKPTKTAMPAKGATQQRDSNLSIGSLSPDEAMQAMLNIAPADVKRILASKPGKKK